MRNPIFIFEIVKITEKQHTFPIIMSNLHGCETEVLIDRIADKLCSPILRSCDVLNKASKKSVTLKFAYLHISHS